MMRLLLPIICVVLISVGCSKYPTDSVTNEELDLIGSLYSQSADFTTYTTFAIVDSVVRLKREADEVEVDTGVSRYSDRIINLMVENMEARGYVRVSKDSTPDLGIDASVLIDENVGSYTYWGGYPGYWGWYGYSYWYSWPVTTYYRYERGTLAINMVDLANRDSVNKQLNVIWNNVAAGILADNGSANASRVDRAINTMFEQSQYVRR